jgi:hypothetical protein
MSEHTPGPWALSDISRDMIYDLNGDLFALIIKGESDKTKLENAYVISAAPDMLAVLKKIRDYHVNHHVLFEIDAAIAKATGETE